MIRRLVDFALNSRFLVLALAILLFVWGIISFKNLPIEAYPDVANNYVQVITQWPGIAAEEVEQQVTIPLEIVMNGLPHLAHSASTVHDPLPAVQCRRNGLPLGHSQIVCHSLRGRKPARNGRTRRYVSGD